MGAYRTCPACGAALDPGEQCDCAEKSDPKGQSYQHDSHKEACRRYGHYVQPGFRLH